MKKILQFKILLLSMVITGTIAVAPIAVQAGISANAGMMSDYIWRGMNQSSKNTRQFTAQGGIDYEADNGLFVGTWAASLEKGYEYDLYAGWGGEFKRVDLGVAYTAYRYTEDSAANSLNFEEVNLSVGFKMISVGYDINVSEDASDTHYSISADLGDVAEGMVLTYGATIEPDVKDKTYLDVGYSVQVEGFDFSTNMIFSNKVASDNKAHLVFGLAKSFVLM